MVVCLCQGITRDVIEAAVAACPAADAFTLALSLGLDHPRCCGRCLEEAETLFHAPARTGATP